MSYSVGVLGTPDEIIRSMWTVFEERYLEPAPGVERQFDLALEFAQDFLDEFSTEGGKQVSMTIQGHAQQAETDYSNIQISINQLQTGQVEGV